MKLDILAIGVHPDDIELSACGTLLKHKAMGYNFGLLDLTEGELGTRGTTKIRKREAADSAKIMSASVRVTLDLKDGFFENNPENVLKIVAVLRQYQPDIVLINAPDDRHPDHGRAAKLSADACFYAGLRRIETHDDEGKTQSEWRPKAVYHYIQDRHLQPDFVVDITEYFDKKMECIKAFKSQFYDPNNAEPSTPISSADFLEVVAAKNRVFARSIATTYAEGFINTRVPGVGNLFDLL